MYERVWGVCVCSQARGQGREVRKGWVRKGLPTQGFKSCHFRPELQLPKLIYLTTQPKDFVHRGQSQASVRPDLPLYPLFGDTEIPNCWGA